MGQVAGLSEIKASWASQQSWAWAGAWLSLAIPVIWIMSVKFLSERPCVMKSYFVTTFTNCNSFWIWPNLGCIYPYRNHLMWGRRLSPLFCQLFHFPEPWKSPFYLEQVLKLVYLQIPSTLFMLSALINFPIKFENVHHYLSAPHWCKISYIFILIWILKKIIKHWTGFYLGMTLKKNRFYSDIDQKGGRVSCRNHFFLKP